MADQNSTPNLNTSQNSPESGGADRAGLQFDVMPELASNKNAPQPMSDILKTGAMGNPGAVPVPKPAANDLDTAPSGPLGEKEIYGSTRRTRLVLMGASALVILVLVGFAVYWFGLRKKVQPNPKPNAAVNVTSPSNPSTPPQTLPTDWLMRYFKTDNQNDPKVGGPSGDPDHDGLTNWEEYQLGIDPTNPDVDGDGVANGDEVHVYHTNPLIADTNGDGYKDGHEIACGYDPLVANTKITAQKIQDWNQLITQYGLHEPTISTFKLTHCPGDPPPKSTNYSNTLNNFSVIIPDRLAFREGSGGRKVGIYVVGTTPPDVDPTTDPINITTATKTASQDLQSWMNSLYQVGKDYQQAIPVQAGGVAGIKIIGLANSGVCPSDQTFFGKGETVVVLTLTCDKMTPYVPLYGNIIQSFKFTQ